MRRAARNSARLVWRGVARNFCAHNLARSATQSSDRPPAILRRYATPALLGAATYAFLRQLNEDTILFPNLPIPDWVVASVPFILALALRALAWTYRLALPHWARKTEYFFFQKSERIEVKMESAKKLEDQDVG